MNIKIEQMFADDLQDDQGEFIPLISDGDNNFEFEMKEGDLLPILPLRNMVLYPSVVMPVSVARNKSLRLVREIYNQNGVLGVCAQKDMKVDNPQRADLFDIGTIAQIVRILEMPDGSTTVILEGKRRMQLHEIEETDPYFKGKVTLLDEVSPGDEDRVFAALIEAIKELAVKIIKNSGSIPPEISFAIKNIENRGSLINYICGNFGLKVPDKQHLLEIEDLQERGYQLLELLNKESQLLEIKASIQAKAREDIEQQQREYFLQQQMKTIQDELGGDSKQQEIEELKAKAKNKKWTDTVKAIFEKELTKLERMHPHSPDFGVQTNYVDTILNIPWGEYTQDDFNLKRAQKILDKDHFGMEKVKERIIEHLAVLKLKGDMKSPIICLYGPPGVGKTSLGKSIAKTLNRKYIRVSLGGLHDEAEIRGHRRTYIGAMPGRIVQNLIKVGSVNPVFILDEIDKVNSDYKGDPSSALLEVLDPEQNSAFHDNFLDIDVDLSKVFFIATANNINTIAQPLLDRMELIEVSGYIVEEKIEIASRHLVPKQMENHGVEKGQVTVPKATLRQIVESYTRESGVRELDRKIAKIMRRVARKIAMGEELNAEIKVEDLKEYLGTVEYSKDKYQGNDYYGVVTGLAWTAVGGEILFVESSLSKGKGSKLTLTGNLGDVMKESAMLALEYIKSHAATLGIDENMFEEWNVHVHVPEGAIPKDGPSAGITMVTSLASAFTKRKVKKALAMTGEITLRGKVLPVGGIREKILAAKRAGIAELILCEDNRKDIEEIKESYIKGLTFHYVKDITEVLKLALL
ncbi:MAG: endopeptidase La [Paludibacteraceae bacterium]|nr:endopeptidase La [Paludibacteraceae bacterium]